MSCVQELRKFFKILDYADSLVNGSQPELLSQSIIQPRSSGYPKITQNEAKQTQSNKIEKVISLQSLTQVNFMTKNSAEITHIFN
jgi:hypothetical protein